MDEENKYFFLTNKAVKELEDLFGVMDSDGAGQICESSIALLIYLHSSDELDLNI